MDLQSQPSLRHKMAAGDENMSGELHEPGHVLGHLRDVGSRLVMQGRRGSNEAGSPAIVCILLQPLHLGICSKRCPVTPGLDSLPGPVRLLVADLNDEPVA